MCNKVFSKMMYDFFSYNTITISPFLIFIVIKS